MEAVVLVIDKEFDIDTFSVDDISKELFRWEYLGLTDPIGQIQSWLWEHIRDSFNWLWQNVWNYLNTIRDQIIGRLTGIIHDIIGSISGIISGISSAIQNLSGFIRQFYGYVANALGTVRQAIAQIGANISGIINAIQSVISSGIGRIISFIQDLYNFIGERIASVVSAISSLLGRFNAIAGLIQGLLSNITHIGGLLGSLFGYVQNVIKFLGDIFGRITELGGLINGILARIGELPKLIYGVLQNVVKGFANIGSVLGSLYGYVQNLFRFVSDIIQRIGVIGNVIGNVLKFVEKIPSTVIAGFRNVLSMLSKVWDTLTKIGSTIGTVVTHALTGIVTKLSKWVQDVSVTVGKITKGFYEKVVDTFKKIDKAIGDLGKALADIGKAIQGFVNPLVNISHWLEDKFKGLWDDLVNAVKSISPEGVIKALEGLGNKVEQTLNLIVTKLTQGIHILWNAIVNGIQTLQGYVSNVLNTFILAPFKSVLGSFFNAIDTAKSKIKTLQLTGELDFAKWFASILADEMALNVAGISALEGLGDAIGIQEISIEPIGVGGSIKLKLGEIFKSIAKSLKKLAISFAEETFFVVAFWGLEPTKYYVRAGLRNILPVEIPAIGELKEIVRRTMPTKLFSNYVKVLRQMLEFRGYNDNVINAFIGNGEYTITVTDRFGAKRNIPLALIYELPTPSELCRMMMRDEFASFEDFATLMKARGMNEDVAKLFYLLHFKYPSLSDLYEFVCRCASNMAWVTAKPVQEFGLGAKGGVAPVNLNVKNVTPDNVRNVLNNFVEKYLINYAKWIDYAKFSWMDGFTADALVMLDLMAKLPDKIDARWMFKFGIINDYEVFRIITARGYHPDWIKKIAQAEMINVVSELRTSVLVRSLDGIKYGAFTPPTALDELRNIATINLLGENITVRFIEPEISVISKRIQLERSVYVFEKLLNSVIHAYVDNVLSKSEALNVIKQYNGDSNYVSQLLDAYTLEYKRKIVDRLRYWIRMLIWRTTDLAKAGVDPVKYIEDYSKKAKLTKEETELILELVKLFEDVRQKEYYVYAIINRLKAGAISKSEAINELKKLGINEDEAKALVEAKAHIYTLHPGTLSAMMEYIPMDKNEFIKRLELIGMPKEDAIRYYAYAYAKAIHSEFMKEINEILKLFEYGIINQAECERRIKELVTLKGRVKQLLGVDWIILSPDEIKFLIEAYKIKREIRQWREQKRGR